jgi:hypothetical protein
MVGKDAGNEAKEHTNPESHNLAHQKLTTNSCPGHYTTALELLPVSHRSISWYDAEPRSRSGVIVAVIVIGSQFRMFVRKSP